MDLRSKLESQFTGLRREEKEKVVIYKVAGYYLPEKSEFIDYLITSTADMLSDLEEEFPPLPMGLEDDQIFYYGMDVPNEMGNDEFVITEYEVIYDSDQ